MNTSITSQETASNCKASITTTSTVRNICYQSLSVWEKQVTNVVSQIKQAVTDLAEQFSVLTLELEQAVTSSRKSTEEIHLNGQSKAITLAELFHQTETDLNTVLSALNDAQKSKRELVQEIEEFAHFTSELAGMSEQVSTNARMTNILSLNARVEAARNERNGQGFAVVAEEVRDLSVNSAKIGKEIAGLVTNFNTAMSKVISHAKKNATEDDSVLADSKATINDVMEKFRSMTKEMSASTSEMHKTGNLIKDEISNMLVSLQFQDRVSQILEHIAENMETLSGKLEPGRIVDDHDTELEDWFEIMKATYTTEEQKLAHKDYRASAPAKSQSSVTFF